MSFQGDFLIWGTCEEARQEWMEIGVPCQPGRHCPQPSSRIWWVSKITWGRAAHSWNCFSEIWAFAKTRDPCSRVPEDIPRRWALGEGILNPEGR